VSLNLEAFLEGVLQNLNATRLVLFDLTSEEVLAVGGESQFTEVDMLFVLDLDLQMEFCANLSRLNLTNNSVSSTGVNHRESV